MFGLWEMMVWLEGCSAFFEVVGMGFGRSLVLIWEDSIYLGDLMVVAQGAAFLFHGVFMSLLLPLTPKFCRRPQSSIFDIKCAAIPPNTTNREGGLSKKEEGGAKT